MDNDVLGHLLKIESEAAALVNNAQAEADKRVAEAEKKNRAEYDDRYREETGRLESAFQKSKELAQRQYREELEAYNQKISSIGADMDSFSVLLDKLVMGET